MDKYFKIILVLLFFAYLASPLDLIPDIFAPIGWIDDTILFGFLTYFLKTGKLPKFLNINKNINGSQSKYRSDSSRVRSETKHNNSSKVKKKSSLKEPYAVLGIKSDATEKEILVAYRKAVQEYHPDKVAHLGKDLQELANQKFIEIQKAYEFLVKKV